MYIKSITDLIDNSQTSEVYIKLLNKIQINNDLIYRVNKSLDLFLENLNIALNFNEFIDINLAQNLFIKSKILFQLCIDKPSEEFVPYCLAAIKYFLHIEDGQNDFTDFEGFEDDHIVLEAVIQYFNLEEEIQKYQEKTSA